MNHGYLRVWVDKVEKMGNLPETTTKRGSTYLTMAFHTSRYIVCF